MTVAYKSRQREAPQAVVIFDLCVQVPRGATSLKEMAKNEGHLHDTHTIDGKRMLATIYSLTGDRKKAREMAEEACNTSKTVNGTTRRLRQDLQCQAQESPSTFYGLPKEAHD
jgi:hypothetical protein